MRRRGPTLGGELRASQTIRTHDVRVANHDYGGIDLYNGSAGRIDLVVDVFGYYASAASATFAR